MAGSVIDFETVEKHVTERFIKEIKSKWNRILIHFLIPLNCYNNAYF